MSDETVNSNVIDVDSVVLDITPSQASSSQALVPFDKLPSEEQDQAFAAVELALMTGDYSRLSPQAKFAMVKRRCDILGVDMTQSPYQWGKDRNGKVMLIPVKNLYQQLRANKDIKLTVEEERLDLDLGIYYLRIKATMANLREESDISVVSLKNPDGGLKNSEAIANAMKICWTQAKNRVTGAICAVGGMDESEQQASREAMLKDRLFEPDPNPQPRMITPGPGVEARTQGLVAPRGGQRPEPVSGVLGEPVAGTVEAQEQVAATLPNAVVAKPEKMEEVKSTLVSPTPAGPITATPGQPVAPKKSQFVKASGAATPLGRPPKMQATQNPPAPKTPQPGPVKA